MEKLIFTIIKDQLICNNQYRINLKRTNIPRHFADFDGSFFWSAEILRYDEERHKIHAKVLNYDASKEEFVNAESLSYRFSHIYFDSLNLDAIQSFIGQQAEETAQNQGDLFQIEDSSDSQGLGRLKERCVRDANYKELGSGDGYLTYDFVHNGQKERIKIRSKDVTRHTFLHRKDFIDGLGKETAEINIDLYENGIMASSEELKDVVLSHKIASLLGNDSHAPPRGYEPKYREGAPTFRSQQETSPDAVFEEVPKELPIKLWREVRESVSVNFLDLEYADGSVGFSFICPITKKPLRAVINNQFMRQEFKYIAKYFCNAIGRQKISVDLVLRTLQDEHGANYDCEFVSATSPDLDKIDSRVIVEVQGSYYVDHLLSTSDVPALKSVDDLLSEVIKNPEQTSAPALVDLIVEKYPESKHALQLRFLAGKHLAEKMPLKIGGDPKSFLFIIEGQSSLFLVLETVDSKLATYLWACPDTKEDLAIKTKEIESLVTTLEDKKRRKYRATKPEDFFLVTHKYQNMEEDFLVWQKALLEIIEKD